MADRVTFDFETGEIIFDTDGQQGVEVDLNLREKKTAIMKAAGYESTNMADFRKEVNAMFRELGFSGVVMAGSDEEDTAAASKRKSGNHLTNTEKSV